MRTQTEQTKKEKTKARQEKIIKTMKKLKGRDKMKAQTTTSNKGVSKACRGNIYKKNMTPGERQASKEEVKQHVGGKRETT